MTSRLSVAMPRRERTKSMRRIMVKATRERRNRPEGEEKEIVISARGGRENRGESKVLRQSQVALPLSEVQEGSLPRRWLYRSLILAV